MNWTEPVIRRAARAAEIDLLATELRALLKPKNAGVERVRIERLFRAALTALAEPNPVLAMRECVEWAHARWSIPTIRAVWEQAAGPDGRSVIAVEAFARWLRDARDAAWDNERRAATERRSS